MRDKWAFVSEIIVEILNPESSAFCFSDNVDYLDATALHVAEVGDLFGASFPYIRQFENLISLVREWPVEI